MSTTLGLVDGVRVTPCDHQSEILGRHLNPIAVFHIKPYPGEVTADRWHRFGGTCEMWLAIACPVDLEVTSAIDTVFAGYVAVEAGAAVCVQFADSRDKIKQVAFGLIVAVYGSALAAGLILAAEARSDPVGWGTTCSHSMRIV